MVRQRTISKPVSSLNKPTYLRIKIISRIDNNLEFIMKIIFDELRYLTVQIRLTRQGRPRRHEKSHRVVPSLPDFHFLWSSPYSPLPFLLHYTSVIKVKPNNRRLKPHLEFCEISFSLFVCCWSLLASN